MAKTKRKSEQRANEFSQQLENVFLAGLGALANAQKMGSDTFDTLVRDGRKFREKASKKTDTLISDVQSNVREMGEDAQERAEGLLERVRYRSNIDKLQSVFDKRVADTMDRLNVPSKNDIGKINKKLNKILRTLEAQGPAVSAGKRKTARRKTPAGRKPSVLKTAAARQKTGEAGSKAA